MADDFFITISQTCIPRISRLAYPSCCAPVAQLDRATASGAVGCEFEPRRVHAAGSRVSLSLRLAACNRFSKIRALPCRQGLPHPVRMLGILSWLIFGFIAGALAKFIMPGDDPGGCFVTSLLGIVGAAVGGWIGSQLGWGGVAEFGIGSLALAILGSIIVLLIYRAIRGRGQG